MTERILMLGNGYMGRAFSAECQRRGLEFCVATRENNRYDDPECFYDMLSATRPTLVIGAAAWCPVPSVDLCKHDLGRAIEANALLPLMLAKACERFGIPFCQLSTGCQFDEKKEYEETNLPTRGWQGYCGTYVGSKQLGEKLLADFEQVYILRLRLPFDEFDHSRNYLSKLASFPKVFDHVNSLTHRGDFVKAALDLWRLRAPFGTYHVACEGQVSARTVMMGMLSRALVKYCPEFVESETAGCRLSVEKLKAAGVKVRHVDEALQEALDNWKKL